jgi:sec-independent protein translocase protein TatA
VIGDIFQPTHLLFLLVIVLLVLGPKRLPEMARSLGRGFRDFKDAISGDSHPGMHELQHQPIEPMGAAAAATRGSAQRPVAAPAPTGDPVPEPTADPVAEPTPESDLMSEPEPVASRSSTGSAQSTE